MCRQGTSAGLLKPLCDASTGLIPPSTPPFLPSLSPGLQVQSQDIAINFLARLVFDQDQIGRDYLHRPEVLDMLRCVGATPVPTYQLPLLGGRSTLRDALLSIC